MRYIEERAKLAKEMERLMWKENLPFTTALTKMKINGTTARILCDYYGVPVRISNMRVTTPKHSKEFVEHIADLAEKGHMNKDIARRNNISRNDVSAIRWLFQVNTFAYKNAENDEEKARRVSDIGTLPQWLHGIEDSMAYWKGKNPLYYEYWRRIRSAMQGRKDPLSIQTQDEIWEQTKHTMQNMTMV